MFIPRDKELFYNDNSSYCSGVPIYHQDLYLAFLFHCTDKSRHGFKGYYNFFKQYKGKYKVINKSLLKILYKEITDLIDNGLFDIDILEVDMFSDASLEIMWNRNKNNMYDFRIVIDKFGKLLLYQIRGQTYYDTETKKYFARNLAGLALYFMTGDRARRIEESREKLKDLKKIITKRKIIND